MNEIELRDELLKSYYHIETLLNWVRQLRDENDYTDTNDYYKLINCTPTEMLERTDDYLEKIRPQLLEK